MIKLFEYALKRIEGSERSIFMKVLIKKILKSIARTAASRAYTNRYLATVDMLMLALPIDDAKAAMIMLKAYNEAHTRSHAQSSLRVAVMLEIIEAHRLYSQQNASVIITKYRPRFVESGNPSWLHELASHLGIPLMDCGHYQSGMGRYEVQGDQASPHHHSTVCNDCGTNIIREGVYAPSPSNEFILLVRVYTQLIHSSDGRTYWGDCRQHGMQYNIQRSIWHDSRWSPYANVINSYHSSRTQGFRVIDSPWYQSNRRAFGCELEIQIRDGDKNTAAGKIHEVLNPSLRLGEYCFFERDGSIGEGFEIVTQPAGLDVHREKFSLFLGNKDLKRGLRSHEGGACGFHVHVGREFLTQSQIFRMQAFLNDVRNESLIRSIARRYGNGYVQYKPDLAKFTAKGKLSRERYEALNVTNPDTVEFRIFRGSLRYESMISALEFVNAVCNFCTPGVASLLEFNAIGFKQFLQRPEQRAETRFLRSYLSLDVERDNEIITPTAAAA